MTLINYLTRVHFAEGVLEEALWSEIGASNKKRLLIVADKDHCENELSERFFSGMPLRSEKIVFSDDFHTVEERQINKIAETYVSEECEVLLAFGTAQTIDLAKLARIAIAHDTPLANFSYARGGSRLVGTKPLPEMFAIPTLSGLAAAVSYRASYFTDSGEHALIISDKLIPTVTICDPTLTLGIEARDSASAGAEAITNCMEAYLSKSYNPPAEGIALDGLNRAVHNLERVTKNRNDIKARREMMAAGLNGALALQKGLGASHAISSALEAVSRRSLDQGSINRISLPGVMRFNATNSKPKFDALKRIFNVRLSGDLPDRVETFFDRFPLPTKLSILGLSDRHLVAAADVATREFSTVTNPRQVSLDDYLKIMRSVH